jgi:hypothetical protein
MSDNAPARADILKRDAALLTATVREAGALAQALFRTEVKNWIKGASSPVSDADIAVNDLLEKRLRSATPDYGWLSEESADDPSRLQRRLVWIVDPIDGTRGYLAGKEDWSRTSSPCWPRCSRRPAMNSFSPRADRAPPATAWRCTRHRAPS